MTIAIDDLRPLYKSEKEEMEETLDPLHLGYSPQSIRVDPFDSIGRSTALLKSLMDGNAELLAHMNADKEKQEVEVVYIERKSGKGFLQCRVKKEIKKNAMRLYPHDGMIIHMQDAVGRKRVESQFKEKLAT